MVDTPLTIFFHFYCAKAHFFSKKFGGIIKTYYICIVKRYIIW